jgi:hypothetical protein
MSTIMTSNNESNHPPEMGTESPPLRVRESAFAQLTDTPLESNESEETGMLFEIYEPRSISSIVAQQQALRDSQAAEAAGIILQDIDLPEFSSEEDTLYRELLSKQTNQTNAYAAGGMRVQKTSLLSIMLSPGAQFVYALIIITLLGGLIGLAASIESPVLVLIAGIASPILLPICVWKWIRWLDSTPYYYRLLTSLGEDAKNLLSYRLLWKRSTQNS